MAQTTNLWPVKRLKFSATINNEALTEETPPDFEIQYVDIGNVGSDGSIDEIATYRFENAPSRARRIVRDGDVIISTVRTYLQAIASIENPAGNLIVSTGFAVIRPKSEVLNPHFCKYAIREPEFLAEVIKRSVGISYPAINASEIGDIPVPIPPLSAQRAIADYLDRETERLDALLAEKGRLLGLLAEKRRALITRAVTRGLNPRASLRDSGIPWLGLIPRHWEIKTLKYVAALRSGEAITADSISETGDYPVYGGNGMRGFTTAFTQEGSYVLIGRQGALCGNINFAAGRFWASEHAVVATVQGEDDHVWFGELLRIMNLNQYSQSAAQPGLSVDVIANLRVPIPPVEEQRAIVTHIATATAKLDKLRASAERTIALLKERRAALIAAAVTGRIAIPATPA